MKPYIHLCFLLYVGSQSAAKELATGYDYSREAGAWLRLHTEPASLAAAKMRCKQEGAVLASPTSIAVAQEMLAMLAERQLMRTLFTGIKSLIPSDNNKTFNGVPMNSVPLCWTADHGADAEDCLALTGAGVLVETSCASAHPYFCKQYNATITRNLCGVAGYKLELHQGSCYKFHRTHMIWYQAYVICHEEGADLAVINSVEEALLVRELFKENLSPAQAIIGLRTKAGEWVTVDEVSIEEAGYDMWAPGEPNNYNGTELCGFLTRDGLLNDDPCGKLAPSICEITL